MLITVYIPLQYSHDIINKQARSWCTCRTRQCRSLNPHNTSTTAVHSCANTYNPTPHVASAVSAVAAGCARAASSGTAQPHRQATARPRNQSRSAAGHRQDLRIMNSSPHALFTESAPHAAATDRLHPQTDYYPPLSSVHNAASPSLSRCTSLRRRAGRHSSQPFFAWLILGPVTPTDRRANVQGLRRVVPPLVDRLHLGLELRVELGSPDGATEVFL